MKTMERIFSVSSLLLSFLAVSAIAADKVVVVPLNSSSSSKATATYAGSNQDLELTPSWVTVRSVTIPVETEGIILVNASCYVRLTGAGYDSVEISLSQTTSHDAANFHVVSAYGTSSEFQSASLTEGFSVLPGTYTYNLLAHMWIGSGRIGDSHINALFIPVPGATTSAMAKSSSSDQIECVEEGCN